MRRHPLCSVLIVDPIHHAVWLRRNSFGPDLNVQRVVKRLDELLHIILVDLHYRGVEAIVLEPYIDALSSCSEQHSKFAGNATEIQLTQVFPGNSKLRTC